MVTGTRGLRPQTTCDGQSRRPRENTGQKSGSRRLRDPGSLTRFGFGANMRKASELAGRPEGGKQAAEAQLQQRLRGHRGQKGPTERLPSAFRPVWNALAPSAVPLGSRLGQSPAHTLQRPSEPRGPPPGARSPTGPALCVTECLPRLHTRGPLASSRPFGGVRAAGRRQRHGRAQPDSAGRLGGWPRWQAGPPQPQDRTHARSACSRWRWRDVPSRGRLGLEGKRLTLKIARTSLCSRRIQNALTYTRPVERRGAQPRRVHFRPLEPGRCGRESDRGAGRRALGSHHGRGTEARVLSPLHSEPAPRLQIQPSLHPWTHHGQHRTRAGPHREGAGPWAHLGLQPAAVLSRAHASAVMAEGVRRTDPECCGGERGSWGAPRVCGPGELGPGGWEEASP